MKKIIFNDKYGLTEAVLEGRKTMTRRIARDKLWFKPGHSIDDRGRLLLLDGWQIVARSMYEINEDVAVAQRYMDLRHCDAFYDALRKSDPSFPLECIRGEKGSENKMFVKPEWMPHRILITDIKVEPLQDISDEDALKEGVVKSNCKTYDNGYAYDWAYDQDGDILATRWFKSPKDAFASLIDKISGNGTWESNPWVFAYTFELIK